MNVRFQIEVDDRVREAELRFGTDSDVRSLARWRCPGKTGGSEAIPDALEYARLASKRWRHYRRAGATVTSLAELRAGIRRNPKTEVAMILVVRATWPSSLALRRVAADWEQRYGVRPVLVETYVERRAHTGVSLAAANWRRLGSSQGRGRSSPSPKVRPKSPKDVWVFELSPTARPQLQQPPAVAPLVPRSLFHGPPCGDWVAAEVDGLALGDTRLARRWAAMLTARWQHPQRSFAASFTAAAGKAAYRLIESAQADVRFATLLAPHQEQTARRMAAETVVVLAQDTTAVSYNTLLPTAGLGPVGDERNPGRGLWLHSLQAPIGG